MSSCIMHKPLITKSYSNGKLEVKLRGDVDFDNLGCISVYCEEFSADLGHFEIKAFDYSNVEKDDIEEELGVGDGKDKDDEDDEDDEDDDDDEDEEEDDKDDDDEEEEEEEEEEEGTTAKLLYGLDNCRTLVNGYLNLYWSLDGDTLRMALEGLPGKDGKWMGFGYSPKDSFGSVMVDSHVVVAGFVEDECFAQDYYLSSYEQCDFTIGKGVCPQSYSNQSSPSTTEVIECDRRGDYMSVYFERSVADQSWPTDGSSSAVYAMGPAITQSILDEPLILYHSLSLPGSGNLLPRPVNAAPGKRLLIALDAPTQTCTDLKNLDDITAVAETGATEDIPTISDSRVFNITSGPYEVHPDPPGWGLGYVVNDIALPILNVVRGQEYTFNIMAGPTHPVYLTTSSIGAGVLNDYDGETVFAGNDTTYGTQQDPYVLAWTPDQNTPDVLYYQCAIHQKLGYKIQVFDIAEEAKEQSTTAQPSIVATPIGERECLMETEGDRVFFQQCTQVPQIVGFNAAWNVQPENPQPNVNPHGCCVNQPRGC